MEPQRFCPDVLSSLARWSGTCLEGLVQVEAGDRVRHRSIFAACAMLLRRSLVPHHGNAWLRDETGVIGEVVREVWPSAQSTEPILAHLASSLDRLADDSSLPEDGYREVGLFMAALQRRCAR